MLKIQGFGGLGFIWGHYPGNGESNGKEDGT